MKYLATTVLTIVLLFTTFATYIPVLAAANNENTFNVAGFNVATTEGSICIYPNDGDVNRVIGADDYGFRNSTLLIFDKRGKLIEAGGNIYSNSSGVTGSPQLTVTIPVGGFLVAFSANAPSALKKCYETAMEGAMLYNATMSVIYEVHGSYNRSASTLSISYDNPKELSDKAIKFLFVGNSGTYFNGIPIKLKGLCKAAGIEVDVEYCTFGSAYLSEFADTKHTRGQTLRKKLLKNNFNYVVLQDASGATYSSTKSSVETILPLIEANGATPLLYMRYSSKKDTASRYSNTVTHYENYTRIAEDNDIVCAPVAVAYTRCTKEYPDINLYADDNSHHSKEGSYLAACTFLYKYLGISPVGNSYISELPNEVAAALQKCAVEACDEEFEVEKNLTTYTENGVEYTNIALGKSYVPTGSTYISDKWTDTDADGQPLGKLTDGDTAGSGDDVSIGCYKGNETSITIDLGKDYPVKRTVTDLYGNSGWGLPDPGVATVSVATSNDGEIFTDLGNLEMSPEKADGDWKQRVFSLTLEETVMARYVRLTYKIAGNFCWSSEIEVFGVDSSVEEETPSEESPAENSTDPKTPSDTSELSEIESPKSGDIRRMSLIIASLFIVGITVAGVGINSKRRRKNTK